MGWSVAVLPVSFACVFGGEFAEKWLVLGCSGADLSVPCLVLAERRPSGLIFGDSRR